MALLRLMLMCRKLLRISKSSKCVSLHLTKNFTRDDKKLSKQDLEYTMEVLQKLCNGESLEPKYKDHTLRGNLRGLRDCHIKPDLVLIYKQDKEFLELIAIRVRNHSQIF